MLGTIKRDLLVRGLDPKNVEIGSDGMFVEKTSEPVNTTDEKPHKNALVQLSETTQEIDIEPNAKESKKKKAPKAE